MKDVGGMKKAFDDCKGLCGTSHLLKIYSAMMDLVLNENVKLYRLLISIVQFRLLLHLMHCIKTSLL